VPDGVAISEAVILAQDLSTDNSPTFVNGLLARIKAEKPTLSLHPEASAFPLGDADEAAEDDDDDVYGIADWEEDATPRTVKDEDIAPGLAPKSPRRP
jgi:hypothetical protein